MKVAVYPGSFNPWHIGHDDVLEKALKVFDAVIIAQGVNPEKSISDRPRLPAKVKAKWGGRVITAAYKGLLKDFVKGKEIVAVIRGLRNAADLDYEKAQQYWNEDLGMEIPTFYVIGGRGVCHISSSALRAIEKIK